MRKLVYTNFNDLDGIKILETSKPKITRSNEVLLKIEYLSINYKDIFIKQEYFL